MPSQGPNTGQLAGLGPTGDRLGVHPEQGRDLTRCHQVLGIGDGVGMGAIVRGVGDACHIKPLSA